MGAVFRVSHLEWNFDLAVKVLHAGVADNVAYQESFIREATTWIELGVHPNIVQCWFVRECNGMPGLFLDYLTGGSLLDWIYEGLVRPGDWPRILDIVIQSADGLAHAHKHGVVHRDVKPGNLLVRGDDRVCVTDFGIVKRIEVGGDLEGGVALNDDPIGTPEYSAPEQWVAGAKVTTLADIYALGVCFYRFCTGQLPFTKTEGEDDFNLIQRHFRDPPPPMAGVPTELVQAVLWCLAKKPEERPTAVVLRRHLAQLYQSMTGEAYPRAEPQSGLQRADALNNRAVSLFYLEQPDEAVSAWNQALHIDGQHPETVYNRSVVAWRRGEIEAKEVVSRLDRARAPMHLGLFLLESGFYKKASEVLQEATADPEWSNYGLCFRALGDSLMYREAHFGAEQAYARALDKMPEDDQTRLRRRLARLGLRELEEGIFFPRSRPVEKHRLKGPPERMEADPLSGWMVVAGSSWMEGWSLKTQRAVWSRPLESPLQDLACQGGYVLSLRQRPGMIWNQTTGGLFWQSNPKESLLCHSPVTNRILVAGPPNRVLEPNSRSEVRAPQEELLAGAFAPDGKRVVVATSAGDLILWDVILGRELLRFPLHGDLPRQLLLMASSPLVVVVGHHIRVFSLLDSQEVWRLEMERQLLRVEMDPWDEYVVIHYWPVEGRPDYEIHRIEGDKVLEGSGPLTFTPTGELLLEQEGRMCLWSLVYHLRLRRFRPHEQSLLGLTTDETSRFIFSVSDDGVLCVWEGDEQNRVVPKELLLNRGRSHAEEEMTRAAFVELLQQARTHLARGSADLAYKTLNRARRVRGYARDGLAMSFLAELGRHLNRKSLQEVWERHSFPLPCSPQAMAVDYRMLRVWFPAQEGLVGYSLREGKLLEVPPTSATAVAAADNPWLGSGSTLFQLGGARLELKAEIQAIVTDPTARFALVAASGGRLNLVDLGSGSVLVECADPKAVVSHLAVTPDFRLAVTWPDFGLWDVAQGKQLLAARHLKAEKRLSQEDLRIESACLSENGEYILMATSDQVVRLWDSQTGRSVLALPGHRGRVTFVHLWSHLRAAVSLSEDDRIVLWNLEDGTAWEDWKARDEGLIAGSASPDGRFLVTVGSNRRLRLWELEWELDSENAPVALRDVTASVGPLDKLGSFFRGR